MESTFIYKREINKSALFDGFGIDRASVDFFVGSQGLLRRGEKKDVTFIFEGKPYQVILKNLNNPTEKRLNDSYQIRYKANGEFAKALQSVFYRSYNYINNQYIIWEKSRPTKRFHPSIPEEYKEYLVISMTENPDVFVCEPIFVDDMAVMKEMAGTRAERLIEQYFDTEQEDEGAGIVMKPGVIKMRRLNRKIGESLKAHYQYRCQICGEMIGEKYDSHLVETHHIDYFSYSLNNDVKNLLIVCPNHHGVIHDRNPRFNWDRCTYTYPNGLEEGLLLNDHLTIRKYML